MTVYVTPVRERPNNRGQCYMVADSAKELHAVAQTVGREYRDFMYSCCPHYTLNKTQRRHAIRLGAKECEDSKMQDLSDYYETTFGGCVAWNIRT